MMQNLDLVDRIIDGVVIISAKGSIDSTNASLLKKMMDRYLASGQSKFLLDYREVEYVSSAGWGILLGRLKRIKERSGELIIVGMTEGIKSIYKLLELNRLITSLPTIDEAADHFEIEIQKFKKKVEEVTKEKTDFDELVEIFHKDPLIGFFRLYRKFTSPPYNHELNIFQFFFLLQKHGFETKVKRIYFLYRKLKKEKK